MNNYKQINPNKSMHIKQIEKKELQKIDRKIIRQVHACKSANQKNIQKKQLNADKCK